MAVTDADQLAEVAWRLLDDTLMSSGLWTIPEITGYFNQRLNRFNKATKLVFAHQPIAGVNGTATYDLPQDWIQTVRVTWEDPDGNITPITPSDRLAASRGYMSSGAPTIPTTYDDQSAGTLKLQLFPTPVTNGTIDLLYVCTLEPLSFDPDNPEIFDTPDDFVPYVTYGVLADMLSKDGSGQDLERAKYCEQRFIEGITISQILLDGYL